MEPEDVMSVKEAARVSGYHTDTIWRAVREGRLESMKLIDHIAIPRVALAAFMAQKGKRRKGGGRPRKPSDTTSDTKTSDQCGKD